MSLSNTSARWLVLGLSALAIGLSFGPVVRHPNQYFFGAAGDAIHAYYVIAYYVRYDHGLHFTGMNYPFGEHINFPDMQPLLSWPLGWLNRHGMAIAPYTVGILNVAMLLSLLITPVVLLAIGRRLGLPRFYAVVVALVVAFLAPQLERLNAHASLAYTTLVPLLWYLLLRMHAAPRQWRWPLGYAALCLVSGLLHTYFVLVGSLFLLAYTLVWAAQEYGRRPVAGLVVRGLTAALLPLLLFRGWLWLTDPIADRPPNPYGFFIYTASWPSIFLPTLSPLRETAQALFQTTEPVWEGYAYVGAVAGIVALLTLLRAGKRLLRLQPGRLLRPVLPASLRTSLWAAGLLLLLSMAYPFRLPGGASLLEFMGPLKQFRSLGRFAWVFYYVFSLYTAYYLYRLYRYLAQRRAAGFGLTLLLLLFAVWAGEAALLTTAKARQIRADHVVKEFMSDANNYRAHLASAQRWPSDFQALLPLPYYNIGTDKIAFANGGGAQIESYKASLNTGLPLLANYITRTSVSQTLRLVQLLSGDLVEKPLVQQFPSRKPILLLVSREALQPSEQRLVDRSRKLYEDAYVMLYELPLDSLAATRQAQQQTLFERRKSTLYRAPDSTWRTTRKSLIYNTFANHPASRHFLRPGAFTSPDGFVQLHNAPLPAPADTGTYEVSVWINARTNYGLGNLQVKQYDASGQQFDHQVFDTSHSTEIYGDWVRAALRIHVRDPRARIEVLYENRDLVADELLIRPIDTDVYSFTGRGSARRLVLNNYPLGLVPSNAAALRK